MQFPAPRLFDNCKSYCIIAIIGLISIKLANSWTQMTIKTIHIKDYVPVFAGNAINVQDVPKLKTLVKELYEHCLRNDPEFHFFFEPEIIIRISKKEYLDQAKSFLQDKNIKFDEYDYPFPPEGKFGEGKESIVANNLNLFIPLFHANSVAAITMDDKKHFEYLERLIHTAFNPRFYSPQQEGEILSQLAALKLGRPT